MSVSCIHVSWYTTLQVGSSKGSARILRKPDFLRPTPLAKDVPIGGSYIALMGVDALSFIRASRPWKAVAIVETCWTHPNWYVLPANTMIPSSRSFIEELTGMRQAISRIAHFLVILSLATCQVNGQPPPLSSTSIIPSAKLLEDVSVLQRVYEAAHPGLYRYNTKIQIEAHLAALRTGSPRTAPWPTPTSPSHNTSRRFDAGTLMPISSINPSRSFQPCSRGKIESHTASDGSGAG